MGLKLQGLWRRLPGGACVGVLFRSEHHTPGCFDFLSGVPGGMQAAVFQGLPGMQACVSIPLVSVFPLSFPGLANPAKAAAGAERWLCKQNDRGAYTVTCQHTHPTWTNIAQTGHNKAVKYTHTVTASDSRPKTSNWTAEHTQTQNLVA